MDDLRRYKMQNNEFDFKIIANEDFFDQGHFIKVFVIRLNSVAMNEWFKSDGADLSDFIYGSIEERQKFQIRHERLREEWEQKILKKFNFAKSNNNSACITQNVAEIFTVVLMKPSRGVKRPSRRRMFDDKEKALDCVDNTEQGQQKLLN